MKTFYVVAALVSIVLVFLLSPPWELWVPLVVAFNFLDPWRRARARRYRQNRAVEEFWG